MVLDACDDKISIVWLSRANLGQGSNKSIEIVLAFLKKLTTQVVELDLSLNSLGDLNEKQMSALFAEFANNDTLKYLNLRDYTRIANLKKPSLTLQAYSVLLSTQKKWLRLSGIDIGTLE
jgi:hypothetical protein